jgi:raffinose/stachyose/melibiose transport system substrate-binding protein
MKALLTATAASALVLSACGGNGETATGDATATTNGDVEAADSFSFTFPTAQADSPYEALIEKYTEETGVQIEARVLPNDAYGQTMRTQLQGGTAADLMAVTPGSGDQHGAIPVAEAGLLEPLNDTSASIVPEGAEDLWGIDGTTYAQPTDLVPVGMIWNVTAADDAGIEYPEDFDAMLEACSAARDAGKSSLIALAGSVPPNPGLMTMSISATRVYAETPDWNTQRADGDVTFADSQGWQDTLQTVLDLNETDCFQDGAAGGGFDAITQGMGQASSLATFVPGGAAQEIMNNAPVELEIREFPPAAGEPSNLLASANYGLAINAQSDPSVKAAAQQFLDWVAEPENAAEFTAVSGQVPITGIEDAELLPQYEPIRELLVNGDYAPLPNHAWPNPGVYDALATGVQGLIAGQGDIASVLQTVDRAWDS